MKHTKFSMKFVFLLFTMIFACSVGVYSKTVNILVNQIGSDQKVELDSVIFYENGIMDHFFDSGIIVSTEPINFGKENQAVIKSSLESSKEGLFEFLLLLDIKVDSEKDDILDVNWKLYNVETSTVLEEGDADAPKPSKDKEARLTKFGKETGKKISTVIRKNIKKR